MAGEKFLQARTDGYTTEVVATQAGGGANANKIPSLDASGLLTHSMFPNSMKPIRLYGGLEGKPNAGQELFAVEMIGDEVFTSGLPSNLGKVSVAPTSSAVFTIKVNGTSVGTWTIAGSATTGTWAMASTYTAASGDILAFYAPASQDTTMSGLRYTFVGVRT